MLKMWFVDLWVIEAVLLRKKEKKAFFFLCLFSFSRYWIRLSF